MPNPTPSLSGFNGLVDGEEVAVVFESNHTSQHLSIRDTLSLSLISGSLGISPCRDKVNLSFLHAHAYFNYSETTYNSFIQYAAILGNDPVESTIDAVSYNHTRLGQYLPSLPFNLHHLPAIPNDNSPVIPIYAASKKCYKPVNRRTYPVPATLPEKFRIIRHFPLDPLERMPMLNPNPPPFTPTGRYTQEQKEYINSVHDHEFLWPDEMVAVHHLMMLHERAFAWTEQEKGQLKQEYFPPVEMPVIEDVPWRVPALPIPPGLMDQVVEIVREKIRMGIYEPSSSSYRTRWFAVVKKDGKSLQLVHDLQPLNAVTICDSVIPPILEHLAESYTCRAVLATLDMYIGYDECLLAITSRDYTTFQTPLGALRLTSIPMGWTNSLQVFHGDITYIFQPEIPEYTIPYVDDVNVKGPPTQYELPDGGYKMIAENNGIRHFIWEHLQTLNCILTCMTYAGGTFLGKKMLIAVAEAVITGHLCTYEGQLPDRSRVEKIINWGPLLRLTDVRAFLGTVGLCRMFIENFSGIAKPLVHLARKDIPFQFGSEEAHAQQVLKNAVATSSAIQPLNYGNGAVIILAVDTCNICIGFVLMQLDERNPVIRYINWFGSITLTPHEASYSQAKLELYGLFLDTLYIRGMINNPDIQPNATVNRWIAGILLFSFTMLDDPIEDVDDFEDWIDQANGFMHFINPSPFQPSSLNSIAIFPMFGMESIASTPISSSPDPDPTPYKVVPHSHRAQQTDSRLDSVHYYLEMLERPPDLLDAQYTSFIRYCLQFFVDEHSRLWQKDSQGHHCVVIPQARCIAIIRQAHDRMGHKGVWATFASIRERFWWPRLGDDVKWYVSYNSQAAGVIERKHYDVRESLVKAADGNAMAWSPQAHSVFWAEHVTPRRSVSVSPFYLAHGFHPVLPLDIEEVLYLLPAPHSTLSTTDLLARHARELQKCLTDLESMRKKIYKNCLDWVRKLELDHRRSIRQFEFSLGDLVIVQNTRIEKGLLAKNRMCYMGPLMVIRQNRGGAYIVAELDRTVWRCPVSAFWVLPYFSRLSLPLPDLKDFLNLSTTELAQIDELEADDIDTDSLPEDFAE
ncbi:hypothetical protein GYMLUDRAFT_249979 [Collybiopsis luxurians FD-317 M1]|uniref:Reverse transcriptase/retrotransposon-derived protein RNase H-like domain-containing protein n=1 Tax=Collybiopsis luxurians FD-317 M1 TaxID=944289 RepID=A0A0D0ATX3_9AGAR|nr:hypothetical protein GYMLUDRAFT_249979 [Collybiopsis luxurians FD-317 M1]